MYLQRVALSICCACALLLTACGTSQVAPETENPQGLPSLDTLRGTSEASERFLLRQNGADFATELLATGCTVNGTAADFAPNWSANPSGLSDAAIGIYRLTYGDTQPVTLELKWTTPPLVNSDCWVAIANWTTNTWTMHPLTVTSKLTLDNPADFLDANRHCYAAVILLGSSPCKLATIGFGVPAAPRPGDGYTLIAPLNDKSTYLVDMDGTVVHDWEADYYPGAAVELLPNGHLLRANNVGNPNFNGGGQGGEIVEYDWDGNVVWRFSLSNDGQCLHHDFEVLPNGNILMITWTNVYDGEVILMGRNPGMMTPGHFWVDGIIEVEPLLPEGGNVVWAWDTRNHLVQDFDPAMANYGNPGEHPELIDLNYPPEPAGDWTHANGLYYNAELDQIALTVRTFSEFWVIDHSTTTNEAAGHSGGNSGKGGDLLYRWGNPAAYSMGDASDQRLYLPHDAHWIDNGLDGAGDFLVFNNIAGTPDALLYSSVVQFTPPLNPDGSYSAIAGVYGPELPDWEYIAPNPMDFYSGIVSGAQRLPGGNTLICEGQFGYIFEIDPLGNTVWEYQNPYTDVGPNAVGVFRGLRYGYDFPGVANVP